MLTAAQAALAFLLGASATGCTMRKSAVWVEPGSSVQHLVFGVAKSRGGSEPVAHLNYFAVKTCYATGAVQRTLWESRGQVPSGQHPPTRIEYGTAPRGFVNRVGPTPLRPGCYEGLISGNGISGTARFNVTADGSIVEQRESVPAT
jgi:hypothetical protein